MPSTGPHMNKTGKVCIVDHHERGKKNARSDKPHDGIILLNNKSLRIKDMRLSLP
jgi:hypothetical protein